MGDLPRSLGDPRVFRAGFDHIRKSDPELGPILDAHGIIKFKPQGEPFESLVESILSQQLAGAAAFAIIGRSGSSSRARSWRRRGSTASTGGSSVRPVSRPRSSRT